MSAPEQTPPAAAPQLPTPADAQAIFDRASQAAERATQAADRLEAAQQAASQETSGRFPGMPAEVVKQISDQAAQTVVQALNAQYELAARTPTPAEAPGTGAPAPADAGGAGSIAGGAPAESGSTPPAAPRKSIAQRILGE